MSPATFNTSRAETNLISKHERDYLFSKHSTRFENRTFRTPELKTDLASGESNNSIRNSDAGRLMPSSLLSSMLRSGDKVDFALLLRNVLFLEGF